jgi:hypothetical protein
MPDRLGLNPTQITGVLVFLGAALASVVAVSRSRSAEARAWVLMTCLNGLFAVEVIAGLRHRIHDFAAHAATLEGAYATRATGQTVIIAAVAAGLVACSGVILKSMAAQTWPVRAAGLIAAALVGLFAVESISLHAIDAILWRSFHQVRIVGWLWAAGALAISLCAASTYGAWRRGGAGAR